MTRATLPPNAAGPTRASSKVIIQPRKPNGPKEGVAQAALDLMISLGGKSLRELLASIKHNTALLEDINKARAA